MVKSLLKALCWTFGPLALFLIGVGLVYAWRTGAFITAKDLHFAEPELAVRDARQLMAEAKSDTGPEEALRFYRVDELPLSLRIPRLRAAYVYPDHINLEVGRNPDWSAGGRIWSTDAEAEREDEPTQYADIYFYQYCNDLPTTPRNQH